MRSTQLVLFLVLMNIGAGIVGAAFPGDVAPTVGGDSEIEDSKSAVEGQNFGRIPGSELVAAFFSVMGIIENLRTVVFYGPEMLKNLGAPSILMDGFQLALSFVVAFDIAQAVTGRQLS